MSKEGCNRSRNLLQLSLESTPYCDLNISQTSKLGWRYFEANKIDKNKLQIRTHWQEDTRTKMAEILNNFEKIERKRKKN